MSLFPSCGLVSCRAAAGRAGPTSGVGGMQGYRDAGMDTEAVRLVGMSGKGGGLQNKNKTLQMSSSGAPAAQECTMQHGALSTVV